uniref:Uncharacterized protein n=1 Tax=Steinernema glaseri TaxID=37863 RepID=A0A1I7YE29_9BILA
MTEAMTATVEMTTATKAILLSLSYHRKRDDGGHDGYGGDDHGDEGDPPEPLMFGAGGPGVFLAVVAHPYCLKAPE